MTVTYVLTAARRLETPMSDERYFEIPAVPLYKSYNPTAIIRIKPKDWHTDLRPVPKRRIRYQCPTCFKQRRSYKAIMRHMRRADHHEGTVKRRDHE